MSRIIKILILLVVLVGVYTIYKLGFGECGDWYVKCQKTNEVSTINTTFIKTSLTDAIFIATTEDSQGKVVARGDVNGDGFEDAIVQEVHCGASCSISLQLVLNDQNKTAKLVKDKNYPDTFSPAFSASGADKSGVRNISIKNGIISLIGKGLACNPFNSKDLCTEEKWNVVKTATYRFDGTNIIQLSVENNFNDSEKVIACTEEAMICPDGSAVGRSGPNCEFAKCPDIKVTPKPKPVPPVPPKDTGACYVGGCSSQLCSDQPGMMSTCEYKEEYSCYKESACERQVSGQCGWIDTPKLQTCILNARQTM